MNWKVRLLLAIALGSGGFVSADDALVTGYTADSGSDRLLVAMHSGERGGAASCLATDIQYNLVSHTEVAGAQVDDNGTTVSQWSLLDTSIASGSNDFTGTFNNGGPNNGEHFVALTLTGVDQASPVQDSSNASQANSLTVTDSVTAVADGFSTAMANYARNGSTAAINGTYTAETSFPGAASCAMASGSNVESSSGTSSATHTVTGAAADRTNYIGLVTWSPAAAAAGRIMSSLAHDGGLAGMGGIAGAGGGLAA